MGSDDERVRLRQTFGSAAERYDRTRPSYPDLILDRLAELGGLAPGDRVLEIGCGTGQLTRSLVARGYRVTAVELSEDLATVARRNVPEAEVITGDFEQWPLPDQPFAAAAAATSFHWIDPAVQFTKTAAALRPGGALAVIGTAHVDGGSSEFFADVQKCYERWDPEHTRPDLRLAKPESVKDDFDVTPGGFFERVGTAREVVEVPYDTDGYLDLLQTFSGHLALPAERLDGLLGCIRALIDERYDGRVIKANLFRMVVGRKR